MKRIEQLIKEHFEQQVVVRQGIDDNGWHFEEIIDNTGWHVNFWDEEAIRERLQNVTETDKPLWPSDNNNTLFGYPCVLPKLGE